MEDVIAQLIRLQELDRIRDKLQRRLDQVPVRLKSHTDAIRALEEALEAQEQLNRVARAESDRAELEVKSKEEEREKIKRQMNAPKLTNREYELLQEGMAGVLADINSFSDQAIKAMERATEAESQVTELRAQLEKSRTAYAEAKEKLESGLGDVTGDLAKRNAERKEKTREVHGEALQVYERVRRKHKDALALVEGTIDRAAGRIGNDLHCSACYMTITANDADRKSVV